MLSEYIKETAWYCFAGSVNCFCYSNQGESMSAQFLFAAVIPAKITCSR